MLLTRWNYTPEEWKHYMRWKTRRKGWVWYLLGKLNPVQNLKVPEVRILADRVAVNNLQEPFHNLHRRFRDIHIREAGPINILEISYEQGNAVRGIHLPIPRGKLREAFEVREKLILDQGSIR